MVVDDNQTNLKLVSRMLNDGGHRVETFQRGADALSHAEYQPPDLVLLDINMPEMDGFEVCRRMKAHPRLREVPVLFISALSGTEDKVRAFAAGGLDYVTKPFNVSEVRARVQTHLTVNRLRKELQRHNRELEQLVQEKVGEIHDSQIATIVALAKLAEHRDSETGKHLERVREYSRLLAEELQRSGVASHPVTLEFITNLYHATPLHDIGKVAIPDTILLKPGKLTAEEFEVMKTHAVVGAETIRSVHTQYRNNGFLATGLALTRSHHERWDGAGYPDGLAGEDIPLEGRIMAVADVYDALRSERVYKPAYSHEKTREIILEGSGSQFDPVVVDSFVATEQDFERISRELDDQGEVVEG